MQMIASEKNMIDLLTARKFLFLSSFSESQLEKILEAAARISMKADTVIIRQGDHSATMYLILEGAVKIEYEDVGGENILIDELGQYQVFGEIGMLISEPCSTTVTTKVDSELLAIDRDSMLDIIRASNPEDMIKIFSAFSEKIRVANNSEFKQILAHRTLAAQMDVEKQRILTEMVAGVAHELNTPLGVINIAISIMARELASPKEVTIQRAADIAESLELMRRNVERAHRLVQDFKKITVSQLADEKELINISEVIEDTIDLVLVNLKRSQIFVNFNNKLSDGQKNWVGYRGILSQILINLLTNVERYAYPNGMGGTVDVTIDLKDDRHYLLTVQDYGKGIPGEDQPQIFEPFFTTGRSIGGTGLGLSIVRNLVTGALKGDIQLKPAGEKGAGFEVIIPRIIPD